MAAAAIKRAKRQKSKRKKRLLAKKAFNFARRADRKRQTGG